MNKEKLKYNFNKTNDYIAKFNEIYYELVDERQDDYELMDKLNSLFDIFVSLVESIDDTAKEIFLDGDEDVL